MAGDCSNGFCDARYVETYEHDTVELKDVAEFLGWYFKEEGKSRSVISRNKMPHVSLVIYEEKPTELWVLTQKSQKYFSHFSVFASINKVIFRRLKQIDVKSGKETRELRFSSSNGSELVLYNEVLDGFQIYCW